MQAAEAHGSRLSPVWVDGKAAPDLTGGGLGEAAAGRHVLTFVPSPGLEVGSATYTVRVAPQAHLSQPIPLPSAPPLHLRNP